MLILLQIDDCLKICFVFTGENILMRIQHKNTIKRIKTQLFLFEPKICTILIGKHLKNWVVILYEDFKKFCESIFSKQIYRLYTNDKLLKSNNRFVKFIF